MRAFLESFMFDYERNVDTAQASIRWFLATVNPQDPWTRRLATKFAVVYAAARMASQFGVAPWEKNWPFRCVKKLYNIARLHALEPAKATDLLITRLSNKSRSKIYFPRLDKGTVLPAGSIETAWGIRRRVDNANVLAIPRDRFDALVQPPRHSKEVLVQLHSRGLLLPGKEPGRYVRQIQVAGVGASSRPDFICIDRSKLPKKERRTPSEK
jgi:hypothetical protein